MVMICWYEPLSTPMEGEKVGGQAAGGKSIA